MSEMPAGYDDWKTSDPDDERCEYCGVHPREISRGWQPAQCTGKCGLLWKDPDYEHDRRRDEADRIDGYDRDDLGLSPDY